MHARIRDTDVIHGEQAVALGRELHRPPPAAILRFNDDFGRLRIFGIHEPDVVGCAVPRRALVSDSGALPVPCDCAIARLAVREHCRDTCCRIEQEYLRKLTTPGVSRKDYPVAVRLRCDAAYGFLVKRQLVPCAARCIDAVQLVDVGKSRADEHAGAVLLPTLEVRGANILIAVQAVDDLGRDRRHVFHHEVAVVGLGARNGRSKCTRGQHRQRDAKCSSVSHGLLPYSSGDEQRHEVIDRGRCQLVAIRT